MATTPLNIDDFAAKIKAKYPEYANVDNAVLAHRIVQKYPEYGSQVDLNARSAPASPPPAPTPQQQPGFFTRLGQSLGLPTSKDESQAMTDPIQAIKTAAMGGPIVPMAANYLKTAFKGAKEGLTDAYQAGQDYAQGGVSAKDTAGRLGYDALHVGLQATPFIGPSIDTAGQDISQKNYSGGAGGLTGVIGQLALAKAASPTEKVVSLPDAAKTITDAVNPAPKSMNSFQAGIQQHLPKAMEAAQDAGKTITGRTDLADMFRVAAEKQKSNYYDKMLGPVADQPIDTSGIKGYSGPTTYYNTATLAQLDARLRTINATLRPSYEQGGAAARAALSAESKASLSAEAAAIRDRLYSEISNRTGIPKQDIVDTNNAMGGMYNLADKITSSVNKERFMQNQTAAGANPPHSIAELGYRYANKAYRAVISNPDKNVSQAINGINGGGNQ